MIAETTNPVAWGKPLKLPERVMCSGSLKAEDVIYRVIVYVQGASEIVPARLDRLVNEAFSNLREAIASDELSRKFRNHHHALTGAEVFITRESPAKVDRSDSLHLETPNWDAMRHLLAAMQSPEINKITKKELEETLEKLAQHWDELGKYDQWDPERKVLHLRRSPEAGSERNWTLPRSVEIHVTPEGPQIYVLHKGRTTDRLGMRVRTPKLGRGSYKEVARSVNLQTLKKYVHATIDLPKKARKTKVHPEHMRKSIIREIEVQNLFQDDEEFVHIAGWTEYKDKDGSTKIGITMEFCDGGELYHAVAVDRPTEISKALKENIENLMQVITDMIRILIVLEKKGIINRDITLANLFLHRDQKSALRLKMGDLGLAWTQQDAIDILDKEPSKISGVLESLPPEYPDRRLKAEERSSFATHTWQMGIVLHGILTGVQPCFGRDDFAHPAKPGTVEQGCINRGIDDFLVARNSKVPLCVLENRKHLAFLKGILKGMLRVNPASRFSAAKLLARLEAFKASLIPLP